MKLSAPIPVLKRRAKAISRGEKIRLHQALDRVAAEEGFTAWSHLAAHPRPDPSIAALFGKLAAGDLLLIAARPRQGKTLVALGLAIEAMELGHRAAFFTLESTAADLARCFGVLGREMDAYRDRFRFDDSDLVSAERIAGALADAPPRTLVVVDYLQLLDQRRDNPGLEAQVAALKRFAVEREAIVVCLSQVDRRFEATTRALPDLADVRLPNPLDLRLFDQACFLNRGTMQWSRLG